MNYLEKTDLQLGYIPLLDCIALLWASHKGYFAEQGLNVNLVKESSWASLRDRLAFGFLDSAHCLSAMLPAAVMGEDQLGIPLHTPLILSSNRAFISLSQKLCHDLHIDQTCTPLSSAQHIASAIHQGKKIQLAHVFKHSIHHYMLREWIALADPTLAAQIRFSTLPPPYMVEAISSHLIDGFCVGEPWNTQAKLQGFSQIITSNQAIIPSTPDKVLAFTHDWSKQHPNTLRALVKAIEKAQHDLNSEINFTEIWELLKAYQIIQFNCSEDIHVADYYKIKNIIQGFSVNHKPIFKDFEWIIKQMSQWEHLNCTDSEIQLIAQQCIH